MFYFFHFFFSFLVLGFMYFWFLRSYKGWNSKNIWIEVVGVQLFVCLCCELEAFVSHGGGGEICCKWINQPSVV